MNLPCAPESINAVVSAIFRPREMLVGSENLSLSNDSTTISLMAKPVRFLGGLDADLFLLNENPD